MVCSGYVAVAIESAVESSFHQCLLVLSIFLNSYRMINISHLVSRLTCEYRLLVECGLLVRSMTGLLLLNVDGEWALPTAEANGILGA